ncbi:hypothetical protein KBTX_04166 [wastewater metagenome]|uniref:Uncharacterized protein n=2 Tax=unclassified sequences TaxID=12908 RepID=A0A5B8RGN1_9ZZZZ|nr:hypothetical protein [Arhodomonas sp. KWT]QEA07801.1 hypothetical protein KBTEX_04166 [uncultured organism]
MSEGVYPYTPPNQAKSWMRPSEENHVTRVVCTDRAIAVIFVPGVMGSNLRHKKDKKSVWLPLDGDAQGVSESLRWSKIPAKVRQKLFTPDACEVDERGQLWRHHRPILRRRSFNESTRAELEAEERVLANLVGHEEEILGVVHGTIPMRAHRSPIGTSSSARARKSSPRASPTPRGTPVSGKANSSTA